MSDHTERAFKAFVKHPDTESEIDLDKIPDHWILETDITGSQDYPDWPALLTRADSFKESGNPVHAIESIILCHEAGLYPPLFVMDWLVGALNEWHSQCGQIKMDKAMGLNKPGRGNPMQQAVREEWKQNLMIELNRLRHMFDLTTNEAATMIVTRLDATDWNQSPYTLQYSETTLVQDYEGKGAEIFKDWEVIKKYQDSTDEEKREVLSHYPELSYAEFKDKVSKYL